MSLRRHAPQLTVALVLLAVIAQVATAAWFVGSSGVPSALRSAPFVLSFALVGAIILRHHPHHAVGWLCSVIGTFSALDGLATAYAEQHFLAGGSSPFAVAAAWAGTWLWAPAFVSAFLLLPVLFPTGHLLSPRWRPFLWFAILAPLLQVLAIFFTPGPLQPGERELWENPLGFAAGEWALVGVSVAMEAIFVPLLALMVVAVGLRYRRSRREERQQLKWYLFAVTTTLVGFTLSMTPAIAIETLSWLGDVVFLLLPVSIGIAVMRYRLYDIDRVVNRTVSYLVLSVLLAGLYVAGVVVLGGLVRSVSDGGGGDLVVAASTLGVAAAFQPLRRRVQRVVDRRFNRARYDASRTVEELTARLRDEVDLDLLAASVIEVARGTIQPAHVSIWFAEGRP